MNCCFLVNWARKCKLLRDVKCLHISQRLYSYKCVRVIIGTGIGSGSVASTLPCRNSSFAVCHKHNCHLWEALYHRVTLRRVQRNRNGTFNALMRYFALQSHSQRTVVAFVSYNFFWDFIIPNLLLGSLLALRLLVLLLLPLLSFLPLLGHNELHQRDMPIQCPKNPKVLKST